MKILVVDDEQLVRWFLDKALTKSGHAVITVSNISDAAEILNSEKVDMIFLDLRMSQGSGQELIRQMEDLSIHPKMVVCSAFITPGMEEEFKGKGISILRKPFKLEELNTVVQQ